MTIQNSDYQPETNHEYQTRLADAARKKAYADPLTGSDRLFSEALRMELMGEDGFEDKREQAIARYNEIQNQLPWPEAPIEGEE